MANLHDRIERMCHLGPEFIDITWGAGGSRPAATLEVVSNAQKVLGIETCMHLICTNNPTSKIDKALQEARACGNQNILALRGDPLQGESIWSPCEGGLDYASDLVSYIRRTHGDYFGIGVAGYPESHPESGSLEMDLKFLKQKVDAGADFVVTQLFFDVPLFLSWVKKCRDAGIMCPIIPGVMPIQAYASFQKNIVGLSVPQWIMDGVEAVKYDDQAVRAFGVEVGIKMTKELLASGLTPGIHYYTFNLEKSTRLILQGTGLINASSSQQSTSLLRSPYPEKSPESCKVVNQRTNPWSCNFSPHRKHESQRPIFWANRPKSYITRTESWNWEECTDGRLWSSGSGSDDQLLPAPTFGDLKGYGVSLRHSPEEAAQHWGTPRDMKQLCDVFVRYLGGKFSTQTQTQAYTLPWSDQPSALAPGVNTSRLIELNEMGYLTINSQPAVNGARSDDKVYGWGPKGGYVYQKRAHVCIFQAYLEFFVAPEKFSILRQRLQEYPRFSKFTFNAVNKSGDLFASTSTINHARTNRKNRADGGLNTVTWGVFPGHEIVQPSIVERSSFQAWKDEAFALWDQWASCYSEGSDTNRLLRAIGDGWYLMNVVNNDYHEEDGVFDLFEEEFSALGKQQQRQREVKGDDIAKETLVRLVEIRSAAVAEASCSA
ncbi:hypothetical protein BGZ58_003381 [Dissophora ornata]|nr:hypothetical protein BGZ58_003381 [Dissophora ornata]